MLWVEWLGFSRSAAVVSQLYGHSDSKKNIYIFNMLYTYVHTYLSTISRKNIPSLNKLLIGFKVFYSKLLSQILMKILRMVKIFIFKTFDCFIIRCLHCYLLI